MVTSKRRYLEAIWIRLRYTFTILFLELGLLYLLFLLITSGLLDIKTTLSVAVTDGMIGIILYYLLGESRRSHEQEIINLMDAIQKFSHLKVYTFSVLKIDFYYVENTTTKEYYKAPRFIEDMVELDVITPEKCQSEEEMRAMLSKNGSNPHEEKASLVQLVAIKKPRRKRETTPKSPS